MGMINTIARYAIDFIFRFENDNLGVAELVRTGDTASFYVLVDGNRQPSCLKIPPRTVLEIEGVEIYLTPTAGDEIHYYKPLEYVRLEVNEEEIENITFNELMAPFFPAGGMSVGKPAFRDASTCINIGKALLAGGSSATPTIKLRAGDELRVVVKSPRAIRGGVTIDENLFVRVHVCTADETDLATKYPDGFIDQSIPGYPKRVPATVEEWIQCHGGREVKMPWVERYITYAKNCKDTEPHIPYVMSKRMQTVDESWMSLEWEVKNGDIVQLAHIGVSEDETNFYHSPPNISYIKVPHYPEELLVFPNTPYQQLSKYPFPLSHTLDPIYGGPGELSIPVTLYNENESITIRDRGTAATGWSTTEVGFIVGVWGLRYKLY
jgi:hypothetical protein